MPEVTRCWVCHRSVEEITAAVDAETAEEREIKKQMSQVAWTKSKFNESADLWRRTLPRDFKDMDFQFIAGNASQFNTVKTLAEVLDAKKLMVDWLADASMKLKKGGDEMKALQELSSLDKSDADMLLRMMDQFESKSRRTIQADARREGYVSGFDGLKLFEGLEFLIAQGLLYYDVRTQLLNFSLVRAVAKKPKKSLRLVAANGYPPVQLCSVCEALVVGLRAPERKMEPQVAAPEAVAPAPAIKHPKAAEKAPEKGAQPEAIAPEMVVAATAESEGVPASVAEIMNKLGPATKEVAKTRGLHEHRATEEWDEVVAQQAKEK